MKTNKDILKAELKNLYALEKQTLAICPNLRKNITNEKAKDYISEFEKSTASDLTYIHNYLKKNKINSGNTVDQIVQEITKNLKQTIKAGYSEEITDLGILTSLIRLSSYKASCYEVTLRMAKLNDESKSFTNLLKQRRDQNEEFAKQAKKVIKKEF